MRGTILQPTYLPWMGYFEMIDFSDVYVVFDHVQFVRKSWQQRNRIKTPNGVVCLTVPTKRGKRSTRICDAEISYDNGNPLEKHWKTIKLAYKKAPYFTKYESIFERIYSKQYTYIRDLNFEMIKEICGILGIENKNIFSSELDFNEEIGGKSEKIVELCKKIGITHLYDAKGAHDFIDVSLFDDEGILIKFQDFKHPVYSQLYNDFVPYLSVIDLLFNEGDNSLEIIRSGRNG